MKSRIHTFKWALGLVLAVACAAPETRLITRDNDDFDIPEPRYDDHGDYIMADHAYNLVIHQAEKLVDIGWILRKTHIVPRVEAANVNSLDEVPDSTWFTNRHGVRRLTREELMRGPTRLVPTGKWTITSGKDFGASPGFVARDEQDRRLIVKFDPVDAPGLGANGDMLVSRFLEAAGYNTPLYQVGLVAPENLVLASDARIKGKYRIERDMTGEDLDGILKKAPRDEAGLIICNVSVSIPGKVKGPFRFLGTRSDDPNDTVRHEDRRDLRGLGILMAWFQNTDARRGNTLDTYVEEGGRRFLKHYLLDFSGALGSWNDRPKDALAGQVYVLDPGFVMGRWGSLGIGVDPIERPSPVEYPSIGFFDSAAFDPEHWRGNFPNPTFERITTRDGFWAAKIVTAFTDDDVRAIVSTGYFPEPGAEDALARTLIERRDVIGKTYFDVGKMNPLDEFKVEANGGALRFADLGVDRGYAKRDGTRYRYRIAGGERVVTQETRIPLPRSADLIEVKIETSRDGRHWGRAVSVQVGTHEGRPAPVRIRR